MRAVFDHLTREFLAFIFVVCIIWGIFFYMYILAIDVKVKHCRREITMQHAHITSVYCREIDADGSSVYMFTERFSANPRKITC